MRFTSEPHETMQSTRPSARWRGRGRNDARGGAGIGADLRRHGEHFAIRRRDLHLCQPVARRGPPVPGRQHQKVLADHAGSGIPFSDEFEELERLAEGLGASLVTPAPKWDRIGRALFKEELYWPGVPAWRYFRKLNFLDKPDRVRLYLDANSLLLSAQPVLEGWPDGRADVIFHARSARAMNFRPFAERYLSAIAPNIGYGYNLGYCAITPQTARTISFIAPTYSRRVRPILGRAPEQAFLNLLLAHMNAKVRLLAELDDAIARSNTAMHRIIAAADGTFRYADGPFSDRIVRTVKRSATDGIPRSGYDGAAALLFTQETASGRAGCT